MAPDTIDDTGDEEWLGAVPEEDTPGCVFGRDGAGGSVARVMWAGRTVLSESGPGAPAGWGVERRLRMYFLQPWPRISEPGVEEALYDSMVLRQFVGIDLGREPVPGESRVCKLRHLLEEHTWGSRCRVE